MLEGNNKRNNFMGKIIEIKNEKEFVVETLDKNNYIIVDITEDVIFEEGISKEFQLGNIIMFETIKSLTVSEYPVQYNVTKILVNEQDKEISIDDRETISGFLGVFPDKVLDRNNKEVTVKSKDTIAVVLNEYDINYEYEKDDKLILVSEAKEAQDDYTKHYWGFSVNGEEGKSKLEFSLINKEDEIQEKIYFSINIINLTLPPSINVCK
ncbi:hypothetical protein SH1V18_27270 [Vallitalea longa]|uniref:Uncharacterized protein n=1 Tax=Vallitalea longa TaxID=2936439 RepID=A0A9W5YAA4_9FIRM|nr:hypothetical protein [Vallitalea longa]GKX30247.1 hypothetical protein SH1V18_27270 [Vallitalea longa]